jgi:hypothetical protein
MKKRASIPASENVTLMVYPPRQSLLNLLLKTSRADVILSARDAKLREVFGAVPFHSWIAGGMLRIMPVWFTVR